MTDPAAVDSALRGIDTVCHQSAKVGLGVSFADAPDYIRNNDYATAILLAAMERHSISRLVLASSMVVYGEGAYADPGTGRPVRPGPRAEADLRAGLYDPRNPETGAVLVPAMVTEDAAAGSEECLRRIEAEPGAPCLFVGPEHRRLGGRPALPQRLRTQDAQRHAVRRCCFPFPFGTGPRRGTARV